MFIDPEFNKEAYEAMVNVETNELVKLMTPDTEEYAMRELMKFSMILGLRDGDLEDVDHHFQKFIFLEATNRNDAIYTLFDQVLGEHNQVLANTTMPRRHDRAKHILTDALRVQDMSAHSYFVPDEQEQ